MKFCTNCGQELSPEMKFCNNCGEKNLKNGEESPKKMIQEPILSAKSNIGKVELERINKTISLQNNQTSIVKKSWYAAGFFALIIVIAFMNLDVLPIHPAIVMISILFFVMAVIIGFMFRSREKKLQSLITGENLIASWTLNSAEKAKYVNFLFQNEKSKNISIFIITTVLIVIIFGAFIIFIDEGKAAMFFIMLGLIAFIALFAFGMPFYYKSQNNANDGNILIGKNYAYINGYFHNWDFPLSGIRKAKVIEKPFYGLYIQYYYTDRTLTNTEELNIPAPEQLDLRDVVNELNQ